MAATTEGSQAGLDLFHELEIGYEHAYGDNKLKIAAIDKAISLIPKGSTVLDVGCGTGRPVCERLANAGLDVTGCDISPKMVALAQKQVKGTFVVADMLTYEPPSGLGAVFVMFSHLQLSSWIDFHSSMHRFACALQSGGYFVMGTMPSDRYVTDESAYDPTRTYAVDYEAPFMGEQVKTIFLTKKGMDRFFTSMGLEIMYQLIEYFYPNHPTAEPEEQQYIIAKRLDDSPLKQPLPLPERR